MSDRPPRLIPYARQSLARLGETRETSLSLDAQEQVISDWAASNGFVVVDPIRDHDLKGEDPGRPGLLALEEQAQPGDTVAVYKWDRLARDVPIQETLVRRLQARNVQVISVTEPSTRLTRVIYGAVNEEFRDALSQRIRDAKRQQAMRGHYLGAGTPYGYQRSNIRAIPLPDGTEYLRPTGVLTIEPNEAAIVREVYDRIASGESSYEIARDFNLRGQFTRKGVHWTITTIRSLVLNRWYYGAIVYKGEVVATGLHEPLIDRDLWDQANRLLERPPHRTKPRNASSWLEGYVLHSCGRRMYLMSVSGRPQFSCQSSYGPINCGEARRHISRRKLDPLVRRCLVNDLSSLVPVTDALAHAVADAGGPETVKRRTQLEEKRTRVLTRYERVRDAWAAGIESLDWLAGEQAKRDEALTEIETELSRLPATPDPCRFAAISDRLSDLGPLIPEADESALTSIIAELGIVRVSGAGVRIEYDPVFSAFIPSPHAEVVG